MDGGGRLRGAGAQVTDVAAGTDEAEAIVVRQARPEDARYAEAASRLIDTASSDYDIAGRAPAWLRKKIEGGRAAVALAGDELVGFGYWSDWEGGKFVSHSGLIVRADMQGHGLGRRLKTVLFESSKRELPDAILMSLTTSPQVKRLNESFGFKVVPLDRLTNDPAFWEGCRTCRNYAEVQARGERCCCDGMILEPED